MNNTGTTRIRPRILIVEDDSAMARLISEALHTTGYETILSEDGVAALQAMEDMAPSLVILDINLPSLNEFEVCRKIREASQIPIIVISGRGTEEDKRYAFDLGVDDYVTKPFTLGELTARVRAVLRRSAPGAAKHHNDVFRYADLEVDFPGRRVLRSGREVGTTPIEFDLLRVLMLNAGKVLTHQMLLSQVWGPEYREEREYLRVHLSHLRRKIEPDPDHPQYIQTIPRIGYRFRRQEEG